MGSRVLGLVRDHYQAVFFGTGPIATAWEIAYLLPNMLRNLLAEGVLSQAFIPIYSDALKESPEEAREVSGVIVAFLFCFLLVLVAIGVAVFPWILPIFAKRTPEEARLLVELAQILFVFILTASLTAIFAGIANARHLFTVPALSPILLNLIFIATFLFLDPLRLAPEKNALSLAFAAVGGGFAQLALQAFYIARLGFWPRLRLRMKHPALKKIFSLMAPAVLGAALFQLNQLMDIAIASYFIPEEYGAVPGLRFAHRLVQLPTGIIGVALSVAILPALAAHIREGEGEKSGPELADALGYSLFLTVPAGIGLFLLGPAIINLLFYGGAWNLQSTESTWSALRFYCLGVPLFSINKVLTSSFYAYQDTKTPVRVMLGVIALNLCLNLILVGPLQQGGLALSTAVCSLVTAFFLLILLRRKMQAIPLGNLARSLGRQAPLWFVLLLYILLVRYALGGFYPEWGGALARFFSSPAAPRYSALVEIAISIPPAMLLYFTLAYVLKLEELRRILRIRR